MFRPHVSGVLENQVGQLLDMSFGRKEVDWPCGLGRLDGRGPGGPWQDPCLHFGWNKDFGCGLWMEKNKQKVMQGETQRDIKIIPTIYYAPVVCQVI